MEFQNKIALVTGAASGIGKATAIALSSKGAYVIAADINVIGGEETIEEIRNAGNLGKFIKVNVAEYQEVKDLTKEIKRKFGRLDIAINNAGIAGANARTIDYPIDDWNKVIKINASSVFYCMKEQIPIMIEQGGGAIVNTASIAGLRGLPNSLAYVASKHAVVGMTKTAAMEYARHKIRINAICPVFTVTPLFDPVAIDKVAKGIPDKLKANVPMKRFAKVDEQVNAILWLCSDQASFVTGHAMPVDGGLTA